MLGTYKTADFDNLFADLQAELDRLRNGYNPYSKSRAVNIHDYNRPDNLPAKDAGHQNRGGR